MGLNMAKDKLKITLVKSFAAELPAHRRTVKALGLKRVSSSVIKKNNEAMRGMASAIRHLVSVEEIG